VIISRTPYRISFFGGGTDYPEWFHKHGGAVLGATIDKYCYITCRYLPPFFDVKYRAVYSKVENKRSLDEIEHPVVREAIKFLKIKKGIEIHHQGDLPARSGMGSSSSFSVGILNALHALLGEMLTKEDLAKEAIHLERNLIKEAVGYQDQIMASYGGFNHIVFYKGGGFSVRPMTIPEERLEELNRSLMLFYTGIKRTASDLAKKFINSFNNKKRTLRIMKDLVEEGISIISGSENLIYFGELLHEAWEYKKSISSEISNRFVDEIYEKAREAGAVGGKLSGAGGGGFILFFVPENKKEDVREALSDLIYVPFKFERGGTQILFHDRDEDYGLLEEIREKQKIRPFRELFEEKVVEIKPETKKQVFIKT